MPTSRPTRRRSSTIRSRPADVGGTVRREHPVRLDGTVEAAGPRLSIDRRNARRAFPHDTRVPAQAEPVGNVCRRHHDSGSKRRAAGAAARLWRQQRKTAHTDRNEWPRNGSAAAPAPDKPDVVVQVSKASSSLTVTDASGAIIFFAPVTTGQRARPSPHWRVEGQRRADEPDVQIQPGALLGREPGALQGHRSRRAEQPRGPRVDRHLEGALRAARSAGTIADWQDRIPWLRSTDELGRPARRGTRQAGHAGSSFTE